MFKTHAKIILTIVGLFVAFVFWGCSLGNQTAKESAIDQNSKASHSALGLKADKPTWPSIDDSPRIFMTKAGHPYDVHVIKGSTFGLPGHPVKIYIDSSFYNFLYNSSLIPLRMITPTEIKKQLETVFYSTLNIEFVDSPQECDIAIMAGDLSSLGGLIALTFPMKFWIIEAIVDKASYPTFERYADGIAQRLGITFYRQAAIVFNTDPKTGLNDLYHTLIIQGNKSLATSVDSDFLLLNFFINHELGHCFGLAHTDDFEYDTYSLSELGITPAPIEDLIIPSVMVNPILSDLFQWICYNHNLSLKDKMKMISFNKNDNKYIFRS